MNKTSNETSEVIHESAFDSAEDAGLIIVLDDVPPILKQARSFYASDLL